jgi:hypothetical protein
MYAVLIPRREIKIKASEDAEAVEESRRLKSDVSANEVQFGTVTLCAIYLADLFSDSALNLFGASFSNCAYKFVDMCKVVVCRYNKVLGCVSCCTLSCLNSLSATPCK